MIKIIKPDLTLWCMCIYKFTFSNGFYYYGATTNLAERIYRYKERLRDKTLPKKILIAAADSTYMKFEIVRFVNDRMTMGKIEESFLLNHVGKAKCLNTEARCCNGFKRGEAVYKIAKVGLDGNVLKIYTSPSTAAISLGVSLQSVLTSIQVKYPKGTYALRRLNEKGEIELPIKPYREYPTLRKKVVQYDLNMNYVSTFESIEQAGRETKLDRKGISKVANGNQKSCGGFIFKLADGPQKKIIN